MADSILSGFQITATLYESANSLVYRVLSKSDGRPRVLKMLEETYPSPEKIAWFRREYETTRSLADLDGVVDVYDLRNEQHRWFMLLEDFGGSSLSRLLQGEPTTGDELLSLAVPIVEILAQIHRRHIIHKDINPSNVVLNPDTGQLKLIDFGISTVLSRENPTLRDPSKLEGTLAYLSPEQTGRMNRAIDYRSDFYSLGVTFYELATGRLPFESSDPLELVHSHIARRPTSPHELDAGVDPALSGIIMKLLAKNAEDRYQSAHGILRDLEEYQRWWREGERVEPFPLARDDTSGRFQIPQKLYGREQEKRALLDAFDRVAAGASEMMLVSGYSGIGKSALVQEIYRPITRQRGYFIAGKFDQLQRDVPYAPLIQAFRRLIRQLLSETEERIQDWRQKLLEALGPNGQVIIDVIPEAEVILGPQPGAADLEPSEARNRFNLVFQSFISVFTQPEHPLALFVDDLQWVDGASLELLQALMTGADHHHLFVIGAYRDNEVSETHPLLLSLKRIREAGVALRQIELHPLAVDHVKQLVAGALALEVEAAARLAELAHAKTGGTPFFLNEFLKFLYSEELIRFDFQHSAWRWSLEAIETCEVTDNVVDLLAGKVLKLDPATQRALKLAACTGNVFDLRTLAIISEKTSRETASDLWAAVAEGLILPLDERYKLTELDVEGWLEGVTIEYKFAHDRVQQAAYSLIADEERRRVHWQVGQLLLENTPAEDLGQHVFDIVHQLDHGLEYARDPAERDKLARLHLLAGQKAQASAAYEPALRYLRVGIGLLVPPGASFGKDWVPSAEEVEESWKRQYRLTLELFEEAAEAACLAGAYEDTERLIRVALHHAESWLDKVRSYKLEIQSFAARDQLLDGVNAGRRALERLGVEIPEVPDTAATERAAAAAAAAWAGTDIDTFVDLPEMTDPQKLATIEIMARLYIPAYNGAPRVFWLIVFNEVILSIKYGVTSSSARGFLAYGALLCAQGEIESGNRFGRMGLQLTERFHDQDKSYTIYVFNNFIRHWQESLGNTVDPFLEGYRLGLDSGDLEFAALNLAGRLGQSLWCGRELHEIAEEGAEYSRTIRRLKQELPQETCDIHWQTALNLLGQAEEPCVMIGEAFDERVKVRFYEDTNNVCELGIFHISKLLLCYLFGEYELAVDQAREAEKNLEGVTGMMIAAIFCWYDSLVRLTQYRQAGVDEKPRILERVDANQEKMRVWAEHAPENFEHKRLLVAAERARALDDTAEARDLYDRAVSLAHQHRFIHEEALTHELAAQFYRDQGYPHLAHNYLRDAHYAYQQWGAEAKVRDLEERFPRDLARSASRASSDLAGTRSTTTAQEATGALDLRSVLKASQALSSEIVLEKLLEKLLRTVLENAGAEKAILILNQDDELVIQAQGNVESGEMRVLKSIPIAESDNLLPAIVNLVARTCKPEVLDDACNDGAYTDEPYVQRTRPKSILCMPLVNQGKLTAILYLENNLATAAFTHERIEVLNLLSAEMAIAIDNARLYTELEAANQELEAYSHTLEDKVTERTNDLAERNQQLHVTLEQLRETQEQLILREKMASLGSLTAGIAHEIRNPLNFVNNFAQLSIGLAEELTEELTAWTESPGEEQLEDIRQLLGNLANNAARIEEHGKRANDITSSMLLHTQASSDERVATDLNELLSSSIRLAYHGMRSREASFNVKIEESYDDSVAPVEVVPQDISRVFINLVENAFYATRKKQERLAGAGASPTVTVSTTQTAEHVAIDFRDNGVGIAEEDLDKIFNPFFTTKPAGEGTGLGLSVSYDIVVRKHQGEIRVDTREGEYTEFTVLLPKVPSAPASA